MKFSIALIALVAGAATALPAGSSGWSDSNVSGSGSGNGSGTGSDSGNGIGNSKSNGNSNAPAGQAKQVTTTGWGNVKATTAPAPKQPAVPTTSTMDEWANQPMTTLKVEQKVKAVSTPMQPAPPTTTPAQKQPAPQTTAPAAKQPAPQTTVPAQKQPAPQTTSVKDQWANQAAAMPKVVRRGRAESNAKQPAPQPTSINKSEQKGKAASVASPAPVPAFSAPAADLKTKLGNAPSDSCSWDFILSCAQEAYKQADSCLSVLADSTDNCFDDSTCASAIGTDAPTCATCYSALGKQDFVTALYDEKDNSSVSPVFEAFVSYGVCDSNGQVLKA